MLETSAEQRPDIPHKRFIEEKLPSWLTRASPGRHLELKRAPVSIPDWYRTASPAAHAAIGASCKDQLGVAEQGGSHVQATGRRPSVC